MWTDTDDAVGQECGTGERADTTRISAQSYLRSVSLVMALDHGAVRGRVLCRCQCGCDAAGRE
jgi:hypothetical protein